MRSQIDKLIENNDVAKGLCLLADAVDEINARIGTDASVGDEAGDVSTATLLERVRAKEKTGSDAPPEGVKPLDPPPLESLPITA